MLRKRDEFVVELNRPAHRVVTHDERAWIVHQHFLRHAAEGRKCALEPGEPVLLLLRPERTHMQPSRMPERCHKHECFDLHPAISTRRSPKSICSCRPGGVSNLVVASASAFSAWR